MSFDYGEKKPDGQHTNHPALPEEEPLIQEIRLGYIHNKCGGRTRMPALHLLRGASQQQEEGIPINSRVLQQTKMRADRNGLMHYL